MANVRRCIGSARFAIEAHNAPVEDFPSQPSQKDGLGRMCKAHWNQYTTALRKAAVAAKAGDAAPESEPIRTKPSRVRRKAQEPIDESTEPGIA